MDKQKPNLIMLTGLPASGKSTYAAKFARRGFTILSSDSIRKELYGDESIQGDPGKVFDVLYKRMRKHLIDGESVLIDATNVNRKKRIGMLNYIEDVNCLKICIVIATPYEVCLERNKSRERVVPDSVIENMYKGFDVPHEFEGWDFVEVVNHGFKKNEDWIVSKLCEYLDYAQHNPHHSLTLGEHCVNARNFLHGESRDVKCAALIHDFGKPFCQRFDDDTGIAHYIGHEHVGAYDALFYDFSGLTESRMLDIAVMVNLHMQPYQFENNEKLKEKRKRQWGEELFNKVMLLHEADKAAH